MCYIYSNISSFSYQLTKFASFLHTKWLVSQLCKNQFLVGKHIIDACMNMISIYIPFTFETQTHLSIPQSLGVNMNLSGWHYDNIVMYFNGGKLVKCKIQPHFLNQTNGIKFGTNSNNQLRNSDDMDAKWFKLLI